jgi:hypothetical protein
MAIIDYFGIKLCLFSFDHNRDSILRTNSNQRLNFLSKLFLIAATTRAPIIGIDKNVMKLL